MMTLAIALLLNEGSVNAVSLIANVNSLDPITWSIKKLPLNWLPWNPSVNRISPTRKLCGLFEVAYTNSVLTSLALIISFSSPTLNDTNKSLTEAFSSSVVALSHLSWSMLLKYSLILFWIVLMVP